MFSIFLVEEYLTIVDLFFWIWIVSADLTKIKSVGAGRLPELQGISNQKKHIWATHVWMAPQFMVKDIHHFL